MNDRIERIMLIVDRRRQVARLEAIIAAEPYSDPADRVDLPIGLVRDSYDVLAAELADAEERLSALESEPGLSEADQIAALEAFLAQAPHGMSASPIETERRLGAEALLAELQ